MRAGNPFQSGHYGGVPTSHQSVEDRVRAVKTFTPEQCDAALQVEGLQKTVEKAVHARMRKLEREAKWRRKMVGGTQ